MANAVKLTILFNNPFWIGVFEESKGEDYKVCKVTFGAEPKDAEVYDFIVQNYYKLKFKIIEDDKKDGIITSDFEKINPKRIQKLIKKEVQNKGICTKAQAALKAQHEENKIERKKKSKEEKESEKQKLYELKKYKRREKHKGH